MTGGAGFCFAVATAGVHKGSEPTVGRRLMLQLQYSLLPCFAYEYKPVALDGTVGIDAYVNRLMVCGRPEDGTAP